jgi:hypothetical protein
MTHLQSVSPTTTTTVTERRQLVKPGKRQAMNNTIKVEQTRFPRLTRAILRRLDRDELADVARHGADAGWSGFTYYTDTVAFYKAHKGNILDLAKQMADDFGQSMIEMVKGFRCLNDAYSADEIAEAIYSGRGEAADVIRNAMAWFALEEVARELNPDL